jgi:hypothetical protein
VKRIDIILFTLALGFGPLMAYSANRWMDAADRGRVEMETAKRELLASAGLMALHHKVYAEVGEREWEGRVKPAFLSKITLETVKATGNILPDWPEIVSWVRANPARARELLEASK